MRPAPRPDSNPDARSGSEAVPPAGLRTTSGTDLAPGAHSDRGLAGRLRGWRALLSIIGVLVLVQVALLGVPLLMGAPSATAQDGRLDSLQLPPGFQIGLFAANLDGVRFMTVGPSGDMYASLMSQGEIVRLPDRNGDGVADDTVVVAEGLNNPHGLAFHDGALYVGETNQVSRLWDDDGDGVFDRHEHLADLPANGGHSTRTVGFGPDGMLYVSIGSSCNVCNERDARRATIMQFKPDGSDGRVYARGLRNAVGFVFNPTTGDLYATNNGRDQLGDNVPPETVNIVHDGDDFGWPRCINGATPDPQFGTPGACDGVSRPAVEMQAHSAPLGLAFYEGSQFPQGYQGDLFVAFHGSWNRSIPTGYKVVRLRMQDGRPTGEVQDFVTGWLQGTRAWGRPVDVISAPDGALLISDDKAGQIYRVTYAG